MARRGKRGRGRKGGKARINTPMMNAFGRGKGKGRGKKSR